MSSPARATIRIANQFPIWTKIRRDRGSLGFRFIDSYGHEIDEANRVVAAMLASLFLQTLDENQISEVEVASIPRDVSLAKPFAVYAGDQKLKVYTRLIDFYVTKEPAAFIDRESWSVYFRNVTGDSALYQGAFVWPLTRTSYYVWNDFDEFGLLLGLERIPGESNADFRRRMLTVGQLAPASSQVRLEADWARRLGLIQELEWPDDRYPLHIPGAHPSACFVDGVLYPAEETEDGVILQPPEDAEGMTRRVVALLRIRSSPLWQQDSNEWLYNKLHSVWSDGNSAYYALAKEIAKNAPVLWGEIRPGESYWEAGKASELGLGHIPSLMDPVIFRG